MNKIDEIIQKWGNREEAYRLYRLVLFDYYLTRYFELTERKLDGIKHHGINDKALINLLFVCLNSVEKESCGLFEAFRNFKIVCGWSRRILTVSQPDVERLFVLIPEHRSNNGKWEKRPVGHRTKIWTALGEKSIADYIRDSSVGHYARLIDRGVDEVLEKLPPYCLVDLTAGRRAQSEWVEWINRTARMHLTNDIAVGSAGRYYDICKRFSTQMLEEDKMLLLSGL